MHCLKMPDFSGLNSHEVDGGPASYGWLWGQEQVYDTVSVCFWVTRSMETCSGNPFSIHLLGHSVRCLRRYPHSKDHKS